MAASVTINQTGKPAGVAGVARQDLVTGTPVTLSVAGGPFLEQRWSIRSLAVDVVQEVRASSVLSSTTTSTTTLSPINVAGTYAGRLVVDSGSGLGATPDDIFDWSFYAGIDGDPIHGAIASDGDDLPQRKPSFGERLEHNVPDAIDPSGNKEGWKRTLDRWFAVIERLFQRQAFVIAIITTDGVTAEVARGSGVATATLNSVGTFTLTFTKDFPDYQYGAVAIPLGVAGNAIVTMQDVDTCVVERADIGGTLANLDFLFIAWLKF